MSISISFPVRVCDNESNVKAMAIWPNVNVGHLIPASHASFPRICVTTTQNRLLQIHRHDSYFTLLIAVQPNKTLACSLLTPVDCKKNVFLYFNSAWTQSQTNNCMSQQLLSMINLRLIVQVSLRLLLLKTSQAKLSLPVVELTIEYYRLEKQAYPSSAVFLPLLWSTWWYLL